MTTQSIAADADSRTALAAPEAAGTVKQRLTAAPRKRRTKQKDNYEYAAMMRRLLRAFGNRLVLEDPTEVLVLRELHADLDATIASCMRKLHDDGFSWGEIGRQWGISRQAAHQKWGQSSDAR